MATSPTQKSLQRLKKQGYLCAITEHFNRFAGIRQDLFGFIDILAVKDGEILGVQTTSQNNMQARVDKIRKHKNLIPVKKSGIKIIIHGWGKGRNGRRIVWLCAECEI